MRTPAGRGLVADRDPVAVRFSDSESYDLRVDPSNGDGAAQCHCHERSDRLGEPGIVPRVSLSANDRRQRQQPGAAGRGPGGASAGL